VAGGAITLVLGKTIPREMTVKGDHGPVPQDLGDDTGRGNGRAASIALGHSLAGSREIRGLQSIDQNTLRNRLQLGQRPSHGFQRCLKNFDTIDTGG